MTNKEPADLSAWWREDTRDDQIAAMSASLLRMIAQRDEARRERVLAYRERNEAIRQRDSARRWAMDFESDLAERDAANFRTNAVAARILGIPGESA